MHIDVIETIKRLTNRLLEDEHGINTLAFNELMHLNNLVGLQVGRVDATNGRYYKPETDNDANHS